MTGGSRHTICQQHYSRELPGTKHLAAAAFYEAMIAGIGKINSTPSSNQNQKESFRPGTSGVTGTD
jgi:hypothetical protein